MILNIPVYFSYSSVVIFQILQLSVFLSFDFLVVIVFCSVVVFYTSVVIFHSSVVIFNS